MRKLIKASAVALALAVFGSGAALAEVDVYWNTTEDKDVVIREYQSIFKDIEIDVRLAALYTSAAKATGAINSDITDNTVNPGAGPIVNGTRGSSALDIGLDSVLLIPNTRDQNLDFEARTEGSILDNDGIVQANQDVGNLSNQGNVASVAADLPNEGPGDGRLAVAEAYAEQNSERNTVVHREGALSETPIVDSYLLGSINNNTGIVHFNQNAGNANNQHNMLVAAIGGDTAVALADAGLSQYNAGNQVLEINSVKQDEINGSVTGNSGIVLVNQSSGNMNQQATIINLAALSSSVGLGGGS